MEFFILPWEWTCDFRLRDLRFYIKMHPVQWRKIARHFWRDLTGQKRTYRVRSQISGEVLASTDSLKVAKEIAHREGFITWGRKRYPRRYVANEDRLVVYAPKPAKMRGLKIP